jgi:hypothetical protein
VNFCLAYIDPGSGSFLVQALIAAALGIVFFFRNIGNGIRSLFWRGKRRKGPTEPGSDNR